MIINRRQKAKETKRSTLRRMSLLYKFALGIAALLSITGQVFIQSVIVKQSHNSRVINIFPVHSVNWAFCSKTLSICPKFFITL